MKILFTIAHYCHSEGGKYGSLRNPQRRVLALRQVILALRQNFQAPQCMLNISCKQAELANKNYGSQVDIVICTTQGHHILDALQIPNHYYSHCQMQSPPKELGFACQQVLRDHLGNYDYYCYLEDDIVISDPLFFQKLNWFNQQTNDHFVLQPNRYELLIKGPFLKGYIDGNLNERVTARYRQPQSSAVINGSFLSKPVSFHRALNPHSGCFFLNTRQMQYWTEQAWFLDRDHSFISPLESAATLGILKTFCVYKPAPQNAAFLEVQHVDPAYLQLVGQQIAIDPALSQTNKMDWP